MENVIHSYETMFIINPQLSEEETKAIVEKFKTLIGEHASEISAVNEWGKRRLAYPIQDEVEGYYVFATFTTAPEFPAELDRNYRITDGVLRSLIVKKED